MPSLKFHFRGEKGAQFSLPVNNSAFCPSRQLEPSSPTSLYPQSILVKQSQATANVEMCSSVSLCFSLFTFTLLTYTCKEQQQTPIARKRRASIQSIIMLQKLRRILENTTHPLHQLLVQRRRTLTRRLRPPTWKTERYRRSFLPGAIKLYNSSL